MRVVRAPVREEKNSSVDRKCPDVRLHPPAVNDWKSRSGSSFFDPGAPERRRLKAYYHLTAAAEIF
ncbi:MAG: hypothetical protein IKP86_11435 [Anaerolineaceae bacterium]|nr:hypothetical protein [Anaerolineaceae bacterium]